MHEEDTGNWAQYQRQIYKDEKDGVEVTEIASYRSNKIQIHPIIWVNFIKHNMHLPIRKLSSDWEIPKPDLRLAEMPREYCFIENIQVFSSERTSQETSSSEKWLT